MSDKKNDKKKKSKLDKFAEIAEKAPLAGAAAIAGLGGYGTHLALTAKGKAEKAAKERFNNYVAELDKKRVNESLKKRLNPNAGVGLEGQNIVQGGGGFGNVTQFGKGKGPPKKNMKKGGEVKKNKKPKGCGIARQGVKKAKMITMKGS